MEIQLRRAAIEDKSILRHLIQLYLYDLSAVEDADLNALGIYGYKYLDHYWTELGRHPFLVRVDGHLAGFVLVNRYTCLAHDDDARSIGEFFVMKKYRGRGVGEQMAGRIFDMFPGQWEVRQLAGNVNAQTFWRKVIDRYTGGRFKEVFLQDDCWHGPVQLFDNIRTKRAKSE